VSEATDNPPLQYLFPSFRGTKRSPVNPVGQLLELAKARVRLEAPSNATKICARKNDAANRVDHRHRLPGIAGLHHRTRRAARVDGEALTPDEVHCWRNLRTTSLARSHHSAIVCITNRERTGLFVISQDAFLDLHCVVISCA
jgi:hypothetical protein